MRTTKAAWDDHSAAMAAEEARIELRRAIKSATVKIDAKDSLGAKAILEQALKDDVAGVPATRP